jgi:uncharacterized membrane protein (Fun14 family)
MLSFGTTLRCFCILYFLVATTLFTPAVSIRGRLPASLEIAHQKARGKDKKPQPLAKLSSEFKRFTELDRSVPWNPHKITAKGLGKATICGCFLGYFLRHLFRVTVIVVGSSLLVYQVLKEGGYVKFDAKKLKRDFAEQFQVRTRLDGSLNDYDIERLYDRCRLWFNIANGSVFTAGVLIGWFS